MKSRRYAAVFAICSVVGLGAVGCAGDRHESGQGHGAAERSIPVTTVAAAESDEEHREAVSLIDAKRVDRLDVMVSYANKLVGWRCALELGVPLDHPPSLDEHLAESPGSSRYGAQDVERARKVGALARRPECVEERFLAFSSAIPAECDLVQARVLGSIVTPYVDVAALSDKELLEMSSGQLLPIYRKVGSAAWEGAGDSDAVRSASQEFESCMAALGYEAQRSPLASEPPAGVDLASAAASAAERSWAVALAQCNNRVGWAETYQREEQVIWTEWAEESPDELASTKADLDRIEAELYSLILKLEVGDFDLKPYR